MYYKGKGVTKDYKQSYIWNNLAAAQGHKSAILNRDIYAKKLSLKELAEAEEFCEALVKQRNANDYN